MNIHFIQQDSWVKPGEYLVWAKKHKYPVSYTRCWMYEQVPKEADADMLVVFGGYQIRRRLKRNVIISMRKRKKN